MDVDRVSVKTIIWSMWHGFNKHHDVAAESILSLLHNLLRGFTIDFNDTFITVIK